MKTQNIQLSIVIPVYNAKLTLAKTIRSIQCQCDNTIELILMNDGSTDGSDHLCNEIAEKNADTVFAFHQKNLGSLAARLNALPYCRGKYILYMDADDTLLDGAIDQIIQDCTSDADLILYDYYMDETGGEKRKLVKPINEANTIFFHENNKYIVAKSFMSGMMNSVCGIVWKKTLLDGVDILQKNRRIRNGEDRIQKAYLIHLAKTIAYVPIPVFHYKWYPVTQGSAVRKGMLNQDIYCDFKDVWTVERKFYGDYGFSADEIKKYDQEKIHRIVSFAEKTYCNGWITSKELDELINTIAEDDVFISIYDSCKGNGLRTHIKIAAALLMKKKVCLLKFYWKICNQIRRLKYGQYD